VPRLLLYLGSAASLLSLTAGLLFLSSLATGGLLLGLTALGLLQLTLFGRRVVDGRRRCSLISGFRGFLGALWTRGFMVMLVMLLLLLFSIARRRMSLLFALFLVFTMARRFLFFLVMGRMMTARLPLLLLLFRLIRHG
jgi:hypothetical protein